MVWVTFALCALVIIWAGSQLSRYGDIIAERTGLGGAVVGIVLLSTITSLPELAVSASSIVLVGSPDLAVGGLYGSNSFNLIIIALLDVLYRHGPLLKRVHPSHILSAGLGTAFVGTTVALVLYYQQGGVVEILGVGLGSPIFVATYLVSVTLIYRFERKRRAQVLDAAVPDTVAPGGLGGIYAPDGSHGGGGRGRRRRALHHRRPDRPEHRLGTQLRGQHLFGRGHQPARGRGVGVGPAHRRGGYGDQQRPGQQSLQHGHPGRLRRALPGRTAAGARYRRQRRCPASPASS